jgi:hypothetical protein
MASSCLSVHDEVIVIFFSSRQAGWLFLCILFYTVAHRKVPSQLKVKKSQKKIVITSILFKKGFEKSLISALSSKRGRIKRKKDFFSSVFWGN